MNRNSIAYHDAWKRIRDALEKELLSNTNPDKEDRERMVSKLSAVKKTNNLLDDLACQATCAAFGIENDND